LRTLPPARHDPTFDVSRCDPENSLESSEVCHFVDKEETMLLCDACGTGWHMAYLDPPLVRAPKGDWICPVSMMA